MQTLAAVTGRGEIRLQHLDQFILNFGLNHHWQVAEEVVLQALSKGRVILEKHDGAFEIVADHSFQVRSHLYVVLLNARFHFVIKERLFLFKQ